MTLCAVEPGSCSAVGTFSTISGVVQTLGGVKHRKRSRGPPRGARSRIQDRRGGRHVRFESLRPRASAAPSGTRRARVARAARECGTLQNTKGEPHRAL